MPAGTCTSARVPDGTPESPLGQPPTAVQVLPFAVGAHAAMAGSFRILDFDDPDDPDMVYIESRLGALYLEEPPEVAEYRRIFDLLG